jgi:hypothetical protein
MMTARRIGAGEFHVVGQLVGWNTLKHELARIGILAFVAFEREIQQPQPDGGGQHQHQHQEPPGPMPLEKPGVGRRRRVGRLRHERQWNKSAAGEQANLTHPRGSIFFRH